MYKFKVLAGPTGPYGVVCFDPRKGCAGWALLNPEDTFSLKGGKALAATRCLDHPANLEPFKYITKRAWFHFLPGRTQALFRALCEAYWLAKYPASELKGKINGWR